MITKNILLLNQW